MNDLTKHIQDLNTNLPTGTRLRFLLESMDEDCDKRTSNSRAPDILKMIRQRQRKQDDESQI